MTMRPGAAVGGQAGRDSAAGAGGRGAGLAAVPGGGAVRRPGHRRDRRAGHGEADGRGAVRQRGVDGRDGGSPACGWARPAPWACSRWPRSEATPPSASASSPPRPQRPATTCSCAAPTPSSSPAWSRVGERWPSKSQRRWRANRRPDLTPERSDNAAPSDKRVPNQDRLCGARQPSLPEPLVAGWPGGGAGVSRPRNAPGPDKWPQFIEPSSPSCNPPERHAVSAASSEKSAQSSWSTSTATSSARGRCRRVPNQDRRRRPRQLSLPQPPTWGAGEQGRGVSRPRIEQGPDTSDGQITGLSSQSTSPSVPGGDCLRSARTFCSLRCERP